MSVLVSKQQEFARKIALLITHADCVGLPVTFGDAYRDPRIHGEFGTKKGYGAAYSCHKRRLAVDLLIIKGGALGADADYMALHEFWRTLGGAAHIEGDLNHFSFEWEGHR